MSMRNLSNTQGAYNEGSNLDARPFGGNGSVTQSNSVSEDNLTDKTYEYDLTKSTYRGNSSSGGNGAQQ